VTGIGGGGSRTSRRGDGFLVTAGNPGKIGGSTSSRRRLNAYQRRRRDDHRRRRGRRGSIGRLTSRPSSPGSNPCCTDRTCRSPSSNSVALRLTPRATSAPTSANGFAVRMYGKPGVRSSSAAASSWRLDLGVLKRSGSAPAARPPPARAPPPAPASVGGRYRLHRPRLAFALGLRHHRHRIVGVAARQRRGNPHRAVVRPDRNRRRRRASVVHRHRTPEEKKRKIRLRLPRDTRSGTFRAKAPLCAPCPSPPVQRQAPHGRPAFDLRIAPLLSSPARGWRFGASAARLRSSMRWGTRAHRSQRTGRQAQATLRRLGPTLPPRACRAYDVRHRARTRNGCSKPSCAADRSAPRRVLSTWSETQANQLVERATRSIR